ncbi:hypothetical protein [Flavobacterium sp. MK4S-17]|uniref:hypothetical protein n=1 Tax=Flavobacterium sp. MK4S-17 TaxID=2543737 RepID=UPI001359F3B1|nr:hypothetical protein [Flavobacterium sp. MK4S-17]
MFKNELQELFSSMPQMVQDKLQPVLNNLLERAGEVDEHSAADPDYYEEERELIMKEVNKVKYINDQWQIMNARKNN